jgi:hypothetical protein
MVCGSFHMEATGHGHTKGFVCVFVGYFLLSQTAKPNCTKFAPQNRVL